MLYWRILSSCWSWAFLSSEVLQSDQFPLLGPPNQAGQNWTRVKGKTLRTGHGEVRIQVLAITNKENSSKLIDLGKLQFPHLLKQIMQHLAQLGALWPPRGVGWIGGGSSCWVRHTYTYGWFVLPCSRNQHNIVKQLSSSHSTYLILLLTIILQIHTVQNASLKIRCKILLYSLLADGILKQVVCLSPKHLLLT